MNSFDSLAPRLTCKEFVEVITDYLEGGMSSENRVTVQLHLEFCPGCHTYFRQMQQTIRMLGRLPAEPVPTGVRQELLQRFRTRKALSP